MYGKGRSTVGFVVEHDLTTQTLNKYDLTKNIHGQVTVPGNKDEQSSYRWELGGILSGIVFTHELCRKKSRKKKVTSGTCTVGCDNTGASLASFGCKR